MSKRPVKSAKPVAPVAPAKPVAAVAAVAPAKPVAFRPAAFPATAALRVVATANPKRPGSKAARAWMAYFDAKGKALVTVAAATARFLELGFPARYARSALLWDSRHGFIEVGEPKPRGAK